MAQLRQHLRNRQAHDLRSMAVRLRIPRRRAKDSRAWREAIAAIWDDPATAASLLAAVSPQAGHALCRLARLDAIPAPLFFAEYGDVRRPRKRVYSAPPWQQPQGAAEELYYLGLLHTEDAKAIDRSASLCLPTDLRRIVLESLCSDQPPEAAEMLLDGEDRLTAWALCHDMGQLLLLPSQQKRQGETLSLRHGRWLEREALHRLCTHLVVGEKLRPNSHRQSYRPRLLMSLAAAADLLQAGSVTVLGRAWLAEPFAEQLIWLWRAWSTADGDLRARFHLPDGLLPQPWPKPLLKALHGMAGPFSSADLLAAVLSSSVDVPGYWPAHVESVGDLESLLTSVLHDLAALFGLVAILPLEPSSSAEFYRCSDDVPRLPSEDENENGDESSSEYFYQLTPVGNWLLDRADAVVPKPPIVASTAVLSDQGERFSIKCPAILPLHVQYALSQFAHQEATAGKGLMLFHGFALDRLSMAQAYQSGLRLPALRETLAAAGLVLTAEQAFRLYAWQCAMKETTLAYRPVLETASPAIMEVLMQYDNVSARVDQVVGPRTALLDCDLAEMRRALEENGIQPWLEPSGTGNGDVLPSAAGLWLAGKLYHLLADYLPLPTGILQEGLTSVVSGLSTPELALLENAWSDLREQFLRLLDGETYTPPSFDVDEESWRRLIAKAIEEDRPLLMQHFSVGRGLLNERVVKPYWIEAHRGYVYLRGECDQSGRVLLFRLDRIRSLALYSPTTRKV